MKLTKIYNEILKEDLIYHGTTTDGVEDDEYEMGPLKELNTHNTELRFNNGKFNKHGPNTIFLNDNPIVDFGVGDIGVVNIGDIEVIDAIYLQGGYNASKQHSGYGTLGIKYIFDKLPKINNIIVQCYDNVKGFWSKMGGKTIKSKDIRNSNNLLYTMVITRNNFTS